MPPCPRCTKAVYDAEGLQAIGKLWHSQCFTCKSCNTRLSSTTLTEKSGELYCTTCYAKQFGPKGFGIGGTSVVTGISVSDQSSSASGRCGKCGSTPASGAKFCGECGTPIGASSSSSSPATFSAAPVKPPSPRAPSRQFAPSSSPSPSPSSPPPSSSPSGDKSLFGLGGTGANKCGKCGKTVYFAEEVQGGGKKWHAECFCCSVCKKGLNAQTLSEKDGILFCNACYAKTHGPKGYGFGGGAGTFHYTQ